MRLRRRTEGGPSLTIERLLQVLGADRDEAAERYERLRRRLEAYFEHRGCRVPEELADDTLARVAVRLEEGETIQAADPSLYVFGVARNVLREYWQRSEQRWTSLDEIPASQHPREDPRARGGAADEERLACLTRCLAALAPHTRTLITRYYDWSGTGRDKIRQRQALADELGLPINAIRIRAHRARLRLEQCVGACHGANTAKRHETP